jgi:AraC-like DNA-binding protein
LAVKQRPPSFIPSSLSSPSNKPKRTQAIQEIRRLLIVEGYTYDEVMQQLNLAPRTFYRYLSAVFADDRRLIAENISDEEALNQMAICRDRLLKQRRDILEQIANSPDADFKARIAAHHLAGENAAVALKVYTEGPGILASRHQFPRTSLVDNNGTTGLRLKLSKTTTSSTPLSSSERGGAFRSQQYEEATNKEEEEEFYGDEQQH